MNDIRKEFTIKNLVEVKEENKNKTIYSIFSKYGSGKLIMYEIIKGLYLIYSKAKYIKKIENMTHEDFLSPVININYILEGSFGIYPKNGRSTIANQGCSMYYAGTDESFDGECSKDKECQSITIFCYIDEIQESMEKILGISKENLKEYYNKISKRKEILVIKTNSLITSHVNEIHRLIITDNIELIKLRTIELLLEEMNYYDAFFMRKKKYHARNLIEKIERIKILIDEEYNQDFTIKYLSERENISITSLKTCFKEIYGSSIYAYKKQCRMEKSKQLLLKTDLRVYQIAHQVGYLGTEKYTQAFKKTYGLTPTDYRKK